MNSGLIATRYATALFSFAGEKKDREMVYANAKAIQLIYAENKNFRSAMENPVLAKKEKRELIIAAVGKEAAPSFLALLDILLKNNREAFLQPVVLRYIDLYREEKNIHYGKLITAQEVDKTTEKKLVGMVEQATGGTIELEKVIDSTILGGFLFEVDQKRWDASIKGQLNRIRKEYIEKNLKTV